MPQESQLAHRVLTNLAMPYITNSSPSSTDAHFVFGSADILTSIAGFAERRPGFADAVEPTPTVFNDLQRIFPWERFDGTFYIMASNFNFSGFAEVYQMKVGDPSFTLLYTDNRSEPFDFVVSNNTVYFSNGNSAKKWDPINGLSNWGIAIGSVNNATGPNRTGSGVDQGGFFPWTNPNNVTSIVSYAVNTNLPPGASNTLQATQFGFAIPGTTVINGIQITAEIIVSSTTFANFRFQLLKNGNPVGTGQYINPPSTAPQTITFGGTSNLWGTTWVPNDFNQALWGVNIEATNGSLVNETFSIRNVQATVYGTGGPSISVLAGAGSLTATAGYQYVFCYGNSKTGHISSPTPASSNTGTFTNRAGVSITLTASTDPQVNQIRLFRTTDGGGGIYFELPTSPYPNTSGAVTDSAADISLNISSIAPTATFNDPPTPFFAPVYFSGRIWGFIGNKVWFSGLEEINQGVPEESFPSGLSGNFWAFDQPVQGLGVAGTGNNSVLVVFCAGRTYGISGNTLDTFRRFLISNRRGARNRTCVSTLGGMVAWLDSANQVWATDGTNLEELSTLIRNDLVAIFQSRCCLTFHTAGRFHWLVLSTGTKLYVYDVDQDQWMPPWTYAATYINSAETSPGNYVLLASNSSKALQMNPLKFNDNGATYQPVLQTGLLSVVPDYGTRFSYIGMGSYNEPSRTGYPTTFQVTNNGQTLAQFAICSDENPLLATYTDITANLVDTATAFNRTNGSSMTQLVFTTNAPAARWIGVKVTLANADQFDFVYELFMAYKPLGGR
jgi:hypothetical protein